MELLVRQQSIDLRISDVDGIQIHEYDFTTYTHEIDEYKAYYELCENTELRQFVSAGFLTYADNHFVINHEKCVEFDDNNISHLTDFARANLERCTVKFQNVRINIKESGEKFSDILYSSKAYETFQRFKSTDNNTMFEFARELAVNIDITNELLGKAGYSFDGSEKHTAYMMAITQFAGKSILIRNEFLRNLNIKGLKLLGEKDAE